MTAFLPRNIARGVAATLAAMLTGAASPADAALPEAQDVVEAYLTLRGWLDAFDLPPPDDPIARVPLRGAHGVCVIVRRHGRPLGEGVAAGAGEMSLRRAAGSAFAAVMGDPAVTNLPPEILEGIGRGLTVELEVAGEPLPVLGSSYEEVAEQLEPGLDGVALRRSDRWAMLFPAQMRAANTAGRPERQVLPLAAELDLASLRLADLRKLQDVSVYRFRTIHLAQPAPGRAPFETFRGGRVVGDEEVTRDSIRALASGLADYLIRIEAPGADPLGIMGTYRPPADLHDPLIAPPLEQALVAFALGRYSRTPGLDETGRSRARGAAHQVLHELMRVAPSEEDPLRDATSAAAVVIAAAEDLADDADCRRFVTAAAERVLESFQPGTGFRERRDEPDSPDPNGRAMVALALALLVPAEPRSDVPVTRAAIDAAWNSVPEHQQVALLPWIGWAEIAYSRATGAPLERVETLQRLGELLDASRIGAPDRPGPPDLEGGFALASGQRLIVTAQTIRPGAFLATMLREPALTPHPDAPARLGRHLRTVRFVMQLSVREPCAWEFRNPAEARGGLRAAPWDCDQPLPAQALGLVLVSETLATLEALARSSAGTAPAAAASK